MCICDGISRPFESYITHTISKIIVPVSHDQGLSGTQYTSAVRIIIIAIIGLAAYVRTGHGVSPGNLNKFLDSFR